MTGIIRTSHSSMNLFQTCPRKYYHLKVAQDVIDDPPGAAAVWGTEVHEALEAVAAGEAALHDRYSAYQWALDEIKRRDGLRLLEHRVGVRFDLTPCAFDAEDCWKNGISDVTVVGSRVAWSYDYKTGRPRKGSRQLKLMALMILAHFPWIEEVRWAYLWLKNGSIEDGIVTREEFVEAWQPFYFEHKVLAGAHVTGSFPPRPGGLCKNWCPVKTCQFNGRKDGEPDSRVYG